MCVIKKLLGYISILYCCFIFHDYPIIAMNSTLIKEIDEKLAEIVSVNKESFALLATVKEEINVKLGEVLNPKVVTQIIKCIERGNCRSIEELKLTCTSFYLGPRFVLLCALVVVYLSIKNNNWFQGTTLRPRLNLELFIIACSVFACHLLTSNCIDLIVNQRDSFFTPLVFFGYNTPAFYALALDVLLGVGLALHYLNILRHYLHYMEPRPLPLNLQGIGNRFTRLGIGKKMALGNSCLMFIACMIFSYISQEQFRNLMKNTAND